MGPSARLGVGSGRKRLVRHEASARLDSGTAGGRWGWGTEGWVCTTQGSHLSSLSSGSGHQLRGPWQG